MKKSELLSAFRGLGVYSDKSGRAPHKPLMLLYALGRLQDGVERLSYVDSKGQMKPILEQLLPHRRQHHPHYPFWYLKNDGGLWTVSHQNCVEFRKGKKEPKEPSLRKLNVHAGFSPAALDLMKANPDLIQTAARELLDRHFPSSLHDDVIALTGVDLGDESDKGPRKRDPRFREEVLRAYRRECAVCGFSLRLDDRSIGLDAAHIRWHNADGPDIVQNGLSLCTLHHKLLDRGAFTLDDQNRVVVSKYVNGVGAEMYLDRFEGAPINLPKLNAEYPSLPFLGWHRKEVFIG